MAVKKPCTCGTCPACKTKKNPNMERNQKISDRRKNSAGRVKQLSDKMKKGGKK
jgi:hypothetical protein